MLFRYVGTSQEENKTQTSNLQYQTPVYRCQPLLLDVGEGDGSELNESFLRSVSRSTAMWFFQKCNVAHVLITAKKAHHSLLMPRKHCWRSLLLEKGQPLFHA